MEALVLMETITTHAHVLNHFMEASVKVRDQFRLKSRKSSFFLTVGLLIFVSFISYVVDRQFKLVHGRTELKL